MESIINKLKVDNNYIVICNQNIKNKLVLELSKYLKNITYKTFHEFTSEVLGKVSDEIVISATLNNQSSIENNQLKINNSRLVRRSFGDSISNELVLVNQMYFNNSNSELVKHIYNKKIYVINYYFDDDYVNFALSNLDGDIEYLNSNNPLSYHHDVRSFDVASNEVFYVVNQIYKLLSEGVKADDIIINTPSSIYLSYFKEAFNIYEIDYQDSNDNSLYSFEYTKKVVQKIFEKDDLIINRLKEIKADGGLNNNLFSSIASSLNVLSKFDLRTTDKNAREVVEYLLKHNYADLNSYTNVVRFEDVFDNIYDESKHIFIVNFNQDVIPLTVKDDSYIKDELREKLNLHTSTILNKIKKDKVLDFVNKHNVRVSYSLSTGSEMLVRSSLMDEILRRNNVQEIKTNFKLSEVLKKEYAYLRYLKALEEFNKYEEITDDLIIGHNIFNESEKKEYNPEFTGLDQKVLEKHLATMKYSYSSINTYLECPFKYYIKYVLRLNKTSEAKNTFIGSLCHSILEQMLKDKAQNIEVRSVEECIDEYITKKNIELSPKERYYIDKLSSDIYKVYEIICEVEANSDFKVLALEKNFDIKINDKNFGGVIDKILKWNNQYIVIDYKTNEASVDWRDIDKGISLQLPIYLYLIKQMDQDAVIAGAYLQSVLDKSLFKNMSKLDRESKFYENRRYHGYTYNDSETIKAIDHNYDNKKFILPVVPFKNDGSLTVNFINKSFDQDEFNKIIEIAEGSIIDSIASIENGDFKISPKIIQNKYNSCSYCKFKDICFKKPSMVTELFGNSDFSFLIGGSNNGN